MTVRIYNTLSQKKEDFEPQTPPQVSMYVCGVTPYDETHLGHGRAYVTFDVVRRYLEYSDYKVNYIQNVTDVDDKIIAKAQGAKDIKQKCAEIVKQYFDSYQDVMSKLNVKPPSNYPKATEHIDDMVKIIQTLIDKGFAYAIKVGDASDVYFEVAKFNGYGKLSKRKLEDMEAGARVEIDKRKKSPHDFALWKAAKEGEPSWDSPWGKGRPGWHIECSVMSSKYLGQTFDIHGGGRDLIFPHHENEIAQAEAATGKLFAKYWMHNGFVNINKQKMSKSLGNFFTLKDIFEKFDPMVVRLFLLQTHYRSPIDFSDQQLTEASSAYGRLVKFIQDVDFILGKTTETAPQIEIEDIQEDLLEYNEKFTKEMDDDFNTAGAIAAIFEMIHFCHKTLDEGEAEKECLEIMKKSVLDLCEVLGIKLETKAKIELGGMGGAIDDSPEVKKIEDQIAEREAARKNKDFNKADKIRDKLKAQGIILEDTSLGTKWSAVK
ncbi:MAG: cysteine--tRNA ligase [Candidatus Margulisbacteria bacterium]|nr:cysteine--tRNA ligase [Candidatus Margulisiibacteriota bacterium]MBU1022173.1 cysteine--tRNA ligase [Candidatus Margulisiibacteriota bacterium]MBU1729388.1 cysteine--tRNA ligase [Candidatus Margulisiibacteriota bacterium]MBU1955661.1 cysteine--tRNA ligase [Candidatus Margulisiibacteriota bacterium]